MYQLTKEDKEFLNSLKPKSYGGDYGFIGKQSFYYEHFSLIAEYNFNIILSILENIYINAPFTCIENPVPYKFFKNQSIENIKKILKISGYYLTAFDIKDYETSLLAVKTTPKMFNHIEDKYQKNIEFVKNYLKNDKITLKFIDNKFKDDEEIVKLAIENNALNLEFASQRLRKDFKICFLAYEKDKLSYQFINNKIKSRIKRKYNKIE